MRPLPLIAMLAPALGHAELTPQAMMLQGLDRLARADKVAIRLTGEEDRAGKRVAVEVSAGLLFRPDKQDLRIEVMTFEDGRMVARQAGDGTNLWSFDQRSNSYSSIAYRKDDGHLVGHWPQAVFGTLKLRAYGATQFALHLLDQAFGTGAVLGRWQPWIPTATVSRQGSRVVCDSSSLAGSQTVYDLDGDDETGFTLTGARFLQLDGSRRSKVWTLTLETGRLPDHTDFGFVPPKGSRAVSIDQPSSGG